MYTVQFYINNQRVNLFNDEQIKVKSSQVMINDISKVFTDFTQTFTIPADDVNNAIVDHFYNNDLDGDYIANDRQSARLEINHTRFREGRAQLEGAEMRDNKPYAYKVSFYGDFTTLKDLFGTDKLSDLDYSGLSHQFNGANVQTALTSTSDLDIRYPLISSSRLWNYGDADPNDISVITTGIDYTELFPALKDDVIFDAIELKYGVTFSGNFRLNKRFQNSFTWWKNRKETNFTGNPEDITFNVGGSTLPLADSIAYIQYTNMAPIIPGGTFLFGNPTHWLNINLVPSVTASYDLDVYRNGALINTFNNQSGVAGVGITQTVLGGQLNLVGLDDQYTYKVRSTTAGTYNGVISHYIQYTYYTTNPPTTGNGVTTTTNPTTAIIQTITTSNEMDFNSSAPDQTVSEWFSGTLKESNLTCYPLADNLTYQVEPLEDWYAGGGEVNITPYTKTKTIKVDRIAPYKEINFEFKKSKAFLNVAYAELYEKEYGDLKSSFNYDGGKFSIKLPFENLLFQKFTGQNLQVSYSLSEEPDYKPILPKPVKLYLYENQTTDVDFYFDNGSVVNLTNYVPMGQDLEYNTDNYSMNFGAEQSSLLNLNIDNSLYRTYYEPYILNMFNPKSRKVSLQCRLPLPMLTALTLDDAIILRDKKYRINDMTTNLTTGVVDMVLVSDWLTSRGKIPPTPELTSDGGTIVVPVRPVKPGQGGYIVLENVIGSGFTTPTPSTPATITEDTELSFVVAANATTSKRLDTYPVKYYNPDDTLKETLYIVIEQQGVISRLITEAGEYILTENLFNIITE